MLPLPELIRRAWPIFREAARQGRTLAYTELAGRVGPPLHRRHVHRQLLVPLSRLCRQTGLPELAALVVRKDTGRPGGGYFGADPGADPERAWAEALQACWLYAWPERPPVRLLRLAGEPESEPTRARPKGDQRVPRTQNNRTT